MTGTILDPIPADDFDLWMKWYGFTNIAAANLFGVSPRTIARYRREGGPPMLHMACEMLMVTFCDGEQNDTGPSEEALRLADIALQELKEEGISAPEDVANPAPAAPSQA